MKKKLTAMFLAASAALAPALCAATNRVSYYDPTDPASPHKEVDCTLVTGTTTTLTQGWYVVNADVTIMGRVTVNGSGVNLILCDGATLNATNGVRLAASNSLTIYGQRQGTGALFALRPANYCAGIGGNDQENGGTLTVNGGWMKVWGGQYGAAIGGGRAADGGKLVVNGGTIIAEGYNGSAGIGGGDDGSGGEVEINGGHVTAIGSRRSSTGQAAAGIGAGRPLPESDHSRTSGTVKITGGTVIAVAGTAQGSGKAAQAIGVNLDDKGKDTGTLTLGHMMVFSPTNAVTPCAASNRTEACRQTTSVRIESCKHDYGTNACRWCDAPTPTISNVFARQRWPWNGLVDITCTVSGIDGTFNGLEFAVAAVMDSGDVRNATHLWTVRDGKKSASRNVSTNGNYHLLWDAGAYFGMGGIHSNVVVSVTVVKGHSRVQLWEGGPYWATTNVGAESPEQSGYYFWWGDTVGYTNTGSGWISVKDGTSISFFENDSTAASTYGKDLASLQSEGWIMADGVLAPEHDAAHVHWGGGWRMPTQQELDDLVSKCNWVWTTVNGVDGYTITGKDSASIFLPCAGNGNEASLYDAGSYGNYWSSVPSSGYDNDAGYLYFYLIYHGTSNFDRYHGQSVRPVQGFTSTAVSFPAGIAGDSAPILLDTLEGPRNSLGDETLTYSSLWDGGDGATVTIEQDGEAIAVNLTGEGERAWSVPYNGTYKLTHTTYTNGVASKAETATFVVTGKINQPEVENVVARQRWPWNGLVDITCTVSGIDGTFNGLEFAVAAVMDSGDVRNATHLWTVRDGKKSASRNVSTNGNYHLLWDAGAYFGMGGIHSNVVVSVTVVKGHSRVQLWEGGPYWATTNVGAESPEQSGYYFWWGDTVGYKWENEKWVASNGSSSNFSFEERNAPTCGKDLATLQREGWITADGVLAPEHDAAHVHWGGGWRMPTQQELYDLDSKCIWERTTVNGVDGYTITGPDSGSIFLPCAGYGNWTSLNFAGSSGDYWSSVPFSDYYSAWDLCFGSGYSDRAHGLSVRPVQGFTE